MSESRGQGINIAVTGDQKKRRVSWSTLRLTTLSVAFLFILVNPLLNYYLDIDFIQGWYQDFCSFDGESFLPYKTLMDKLFKPNSSFKIVINLFLLII